MSSRTLEGIEIRSGVNEDLQPFITVVVNGGDLLGQMSPDEVRTMALGWLEAAEAAQQDSIVMRMLTEDVKLDLSTAGNFVARMRARR